MVKVLNDVSSILVRNLFPKDYIGWVYMYCSKSKPYLQKGFFYNDFDQQGGECYGLFKKPQIITEKDYTRFDTEVCELMPNNNLIDEFAILSEPLNGKVVARFWCDKVEEIRFEDNGGFYETDLQRYEDTEYVTNTLNEEKICEKSCLDCYELEEYLQGKNGFAIHISKLEICDKCKHLKMFEGWTLRCHKPALTKAPQNYCYVEGE